MKILFSLFWEMFKIAFCVIGGGYAILSVADNIFSKKKKWINEGELVENLPIFQMVPGIIAGSTAIYVGRKIAGVPGAIAALTGVFLPSVIVFSIVSIGYALIPLGNSYLDAAFLGLRSALTGIIAVMIIKAWSKSLKSFSAYIVLLLSLYALVWCRLNPAIVVVIAGVIGIILKLTEGVSTRVAGRKLLSSFWLMPLVFLKYGSIAFGGGYVLVPVYISDFVGSSAPFLQLAEKEFADVMALTQMTPGPIAVNCATFFGFRLGMAEFSSVLGAILSAVIATLCLVLPGAFLLYIVLGSLERFKTNKIVVGLLNGIKPVTIAMMLNAFWAFFMTSAVTTVSAPNTGVVSYSANIIGCLLFVISAIVICTNKLGVVKVILLSAAISALLSTLRF